MSLEAWLTYRLAGGCCCVQVIRLQAPRMIDLTCLCNHDMWPFEQTRHGSTVLQSSSEAGHFPGSIPPAETEKSFLERKERWKRFRKQQHLLAFHFVAIDPSRTATSAVLDMTSSSQLSSPTWTPSSPRIVQP